MGIPGKEKGFAKSNLNQSKLNNSSIDRYTLKHILGL